MGFRSVFVRRAPSAWQAAVTEGGLVRHTPVPKSHRSLRSLAAGRSLRGPGGLPPAALCSGGLWRASRGGERGRNLQLRLRVEGKEASLRTLRLGHPSAAYVQRCGADRNSSRAALRQCAQNRAAARRRPRRAAQGMRCRILRPGRHAPEHSAAQRGRAGGRKPSEWMRRSGRRSFDFVLFVWCSSVVPRPVGESGMLSTCARTHHVRKAQQRQRLRIGRTASQPHATGGDCATVSGHSASVWQARGREGASSVGCGPEGSGAPRRRTAGAAWGLTHRPRRAPAVHKPTGVVSEVPPVRSALSPSLATTGGLVAYRRHASECPLSPRRFDPPFSTHRVLSAPERRRDCRDRPGVLGVLTSSSHSEPDEANGVPSCSHASCAAELAGELTRP